MRQIDIQDEKLYISKENKRNKTGRLIIHLPELNSLLTKDEGFNKFTGPNRISAFYSPEIHSDPDLKSLGLSQGFGISIEGRIRSNISISAGLSYQANNFSNTVFSGKVPPHNLTVPLDSVDISQYLDSTIIKRGNYAFLELPVSVNFKFIESGKSAIWITAGFSSIAFLKQNYTTDTIVDVVSTKSSISAKAWNNIHLLGSLNLGLTYGYKLNDYLIMQGSLKYKLHLGDLGAASLKLNRLNFQVGLIYLFGKIN
jgi:hypothetical protein